MQFEIIEKKRLDADFSVLNSLGAAELQELARGYERLRTSLLNDILDIADRTQMIYLFLRKAEGSAAKEQRALNVY